MRYISIFLFLFFCRSVIAQDLFKVDDGKAHFVSNAPLEIIEAVSSEVQGYLRLSDQSFAFKLNVSSFYGFNSELQRQHFNDHYMEIDQFPDASFSGKIIEQIDLNVEGIQTIRAKGLLTVHGVTQERIIKCNLIVEDEKISAKATFSLMLEDHNISIPKIVYQKIAEEIFIQVEVVFLTQ
ncbi:MAG: YceI family protein [Chitinophagales bacterium]|nr:YceI family protein [Chitinophagales bacterium]